MIGYSSSQSKYLEEWKDRNDRYRIKFGEFITWIESVQKGVWT